MKKIFLIAALAICSFCAFGQPCGAMYGGIQVDTMFTDIFPPVMLRYDSIIYDTFTEVQLPANQFVINSPRMIDTLACSVDIDIVRTLLPTSQIFVVLFVVIRDSAGNIIGGESSPTFSVKNDTTLYNRFSAITVGMEQAIEFQYSVSTFNGISYRVTGTYAENGPCDTGPLFVTPEIARSKPFDYYDIYGRLQALPLLPGWYIRSDGRKMLVF